MYTNGVMLQAFHWSLPEDGNHWHWLAGQVSTLAQRGFTALWLPPMTKGWGGLHQDGNARSVGYDLYDLWDLGSYPAHQPLERTKHGTLDQVRALIDACHRASPSMQVYADLVFNHKMGGPIEEEVRVQEVDANDKNKPLGPWFPRKLYTRFTFPGRMAAQAAGGAPTDNRFEWYWDHFDAFTEGEGPARRVFRIKDKDFQRPPFIHHGDQPYLMGFDLDTSNPHVVEELNRFGDWLIDTIGVDGFRLDAVKHIRQSFFPEYLGRLRGRSGREAFTVGELWVDELWSLTEFLGQTQRCMSLFDFPLRNNFWQAAERGRAYPLPEIFKDTLVAADPEKAVTFVDNHDLQPYREGRDFRLVEHDWFKPLAYALILLRPYGYPCVFFGDYFPSDLYRQGVQDRHGWLIDRFLEARKVAVGGQVIDRFDHPNCIGWACQGDAEHPRALAVVMSNGDDGWKEIPTGRPNATFDDWTNHIGGPVRTDEHGLGRFTCRGGKVSVWVER